MEIFVEKLENIDRKLDNIDNIEKRLQVIEDKLQFVKDSGIRMNNHISFVESVYDTVKYPFFYIMNKIQPINTNDIEMKYMATLQCEKHLNEKSLLIEKND
jgi:hypothetical protein